MLVTIDIKDSVADKILYFLESFKKDVKIVSADKSKIPFEIEQIDEKDDDYRLYIDAKKARANGEKTHSLEDVMKEFS